MTKMIAARADSSASGVELQQIDVPDVLRPDEVLVRVHAAGLAPGMATLLALGLFKRLPTTVGHEAAGVVASVGDGVDASLVGARVRVHAIISCQHCSYCRSDREQMCPESAMIGHAAFGHGSLTLYSRYHDGGLAEYVRVPRHMIDVIPDDVSFEVAAKVHDFGNAVRAVKETELPLGGTLLINAATGTMGTATLRLAAHMGAGRVVLVGRSAARLRDVAALTPEMRVDVVALDELAPDWQETTGLTVAIRRLIPGGVDAVVDYDVSGTTSTQVLCAMATGATLVHMGGSRTPLKIPLAAMTLNLWRVVGMRACTRADTDEVLALLAHGVLHAEDLITHTFSLAELPRALEALEKRTEPIWMAVVKP